MDRALEKFSIEDLHKLLDNIVGLMERAERRTENGHKNAFRYLPKYSVLLKKKIAGLGSNKGELIEMIKALYGDPYVRMLGMYEEVTEIKGPESISGRASETTAPSPFSEAPAMSPMSPVSAPTPMSPLFTNFNIVAARAAKKAKKGGATRKQTKRSRRRRRQ